ncbi:MAG: VCBS repeat-containing protein, partial [Planctomycetaceae bacterium]
MSRHVFSLLTPLVLVATFASTTFAARPWTRHTIDAADRGLGKRGADGVRLADINGDGRPDVTTGWEQGGAIRVCLNPGPRRSKKPWPGVTVGNVGSPEDAVFADLDGDGQLDVISCCEGRNRSIFVHWAPADRRRQRDAGAWTTAAIPAVAGRQQWMYALPLDVDGRHGIDLVVGSKGAGGSVGWLESPRDPRRLNDWTFHR